MATKKKVAPKPKSGKKKIILYPPPKTKVKGKSKKKINGGLTGKTYIRKPSRRDNLEHMAKKTFKDFVFDYDAPAGQQAAELAELFLLSPAYKLGKRGSKLLIKELQRDIREPRK